LYHQGIGCGGGEHYQEDEENLSRRTFGRTNVEVMPRTGHLRASSPCGEKERPAHVEKIGETNGSAIDSTQYTRREAVRARDATQGR
jgi:hypothetical protein